MNEKTSWAKVAHFFMGLGAIVLFVWIGPPSDADKLA